ncbi:MAG: GDSL-type esterase/lipase family protein [Lautropia sp.]|nr:GDSL-type esterase/lipase family protein [Lautropia sp.]
MPAAPALAAESNASSFHGSEPVEPKVRLAVLGDSDSHAFHDHIALKAGTEEARGGLHQASTWQWTEILAQLRPRDIDQGPFGEIGASRVSGYLRRHLLGSLVRQRKEDFRYNFAMSGAPCSALLDPTSGQVPALLAEMKTNAQDWKTIPSVVLIRIGINSLGKEADLAQFAEQGPDAANLSRVNDCADHVSQAVTMLKAQYPSLRIVLVGILNNVDWPPFHQKWQRPAELANIDAVLEVYDDRLRNLARTVDGVSFFDDRAFFSHHFGGRNAEGKPDYRQVDLGGKRKVRVTQGDEPYNAVLADGHAGTVWNGLWAAAIVEELNRVTGADIRPITEAEVAHIADPDGSFGLWK